MARAPAHTGPGPGSGWLTIHNRNRRGPDPAGAFMVLEGAVATIGFDLTLVLPVITVWPGGRALPDTLVADLGLGDTQLSAGAHTVPWLPTPRDIEVTTALVTAQPLRADPIKDRLERLAAPCAIDSQGVETYANQIGLIRESLSKYVGRRRVATREAASPGPVERAHAAD